jgi:hypothetical protein
MLLIIKIKIMFNLKIFRILNFIYNFKKINRSLKNKSRFYKIQIQIKVEESLKIEKREE